MSKILINTTATEIELDVYGVTIPPNNFNYVIPISQYSLLAEDDVIAEITPFVNSGDIVVNDGFNNLTASDGINYLKYPDEAFNIRFRSNPERNNDFKAKNVQEAIEETLSTGQTINCYDCGEFLTSRVFSGYNSTGGQTISNNKSTIQIDTLNQSSDSASFNLSSGELEFLFSDIYTISYSVVLNDTNQTRTNSKSVLEINTGGGFVEVEGSDVYTYERNTAAGKSTGSATIALNVNKGDIIRISSSVITGSDNVVVAEGSRLSAVPITPASGEISIGVDGSEVGLDLLGIINCGEL